MNEDNATTHEPFEPTRLTHAVECSDAIAWLDRQPADSIDLVFGSPPYEMARLYLEGGENLGIARATEEWVAWMVKVYLSALRCCKGLVAFVVEGQTKSYRYSGGPLLLAADLIRKGVCLRKPPIYHRVGIPGSGGPDWLRNDYEFVVCACRPGKLPWSDNTAMGHAPKWASGGEMSNRLASGVRVNQSTLNGEVEAVPSVPVWRNGPGMANRDETGSARRMVARKSHAKAKPNGTDERQSYSPPVLANPGNVIHCNVGGGLMGDALAHESEAPFPEDLAAFFVRSFCPPGGVVADCFSGSGTTAKVCKEWGRSFRGCDLRESQVELTRRRLAGAQPQLFAE